ncbi:hypothetical protein ACJX0J_036950, partial [Zea mays]
MDDGSIGVKQKQGSERQLCDVGRARMFFPHDVSFSENLMFLIDLLMGFFFTFLNFLVCLEGIDTHKIVRLSWATRPTSNFPVGFSDDRVNLENSIFKCLIGLDDYLVKQQQPTTHVAHSTTNAMVFLICCAEGARIWIFFMFRAPQLLTSCSSFLVTPIFLPLRFFARSVITM